jgi:DNA-binding XRE family transcriptional regulator
MKIEITKEEAVEMFKTQAALARALGIYRQAVHQWKPGKPIPEVHALKIRYQLRPEQFT